MIIRKIYKFENAHIVRNCTSRRCRVSIHGHSYMCEVLLSSNYLDNAGMVYDFGLMKFGIKTLIDSFDHATTLFSKDSSKYIDDMKKHTLRWVELPFNPSAEQFSRVFFVMIDALLKQTEMINGEKGVTLDSIIIHETDTGYAQCFRDDAYNPNMGAISLNDIKFSDEIKSEWEDPEFYDKLIDGEIFPAVKEA
ncbi:MAG: 6-carboxytetrahydropterin synthase [Campylobacter sp.]|nr:6-carboxytetrahydropterin synthase [Campylobacter sp.]